MRFTSTLKFFEDLNSKQKHVKMKLHEKCVQKIKYASVKKGETVFYSGKTFNYK